MTKRSTQPFARKYQCIHCATVHTYMRTSYNDKVSEFPRCDVDGFPMLPASRDAIGPEVRRIDPKRYIASDGWAMLATIGDVVRDRKVDLGFVEACTRRLPRCSEVFSDLTGVAGEPRALLGRTTDLEVRANGSELWVRFDEAVVTDPLPRRALLGKHPSKEALAIAAASRVPDPGDREQCELVPAPPSGSDLLLAVNRSMTVIGPQDILGIIDSAFPAVQWHEKDFYFDRNLHISTLAIVAEMLERIDPAYQADIAGQVFFTSACIALTTFVQQRAEKLEASPLLEGKNPLAVIRETLIDMSESGPRKVDAMGQIHVFVSHSARDAALARALVSCIEASLVVPDKAILCTSVPGYKLTPGDVSDDVLRKNILQSSVVIGLLTSESLASGYVLMELGAAWGLERRTCALLDNSVEFDQMPGPLRRLHALKGDSHDSIASLIDVIADETGWHRRNSAKLTDAIGAFVTSVSIRANAQSPAQP